MIFIHIYNCISIVLTCKRLEHAKRRASNKRPARNNRSQLSHNTIDIVVIPIKNEIQTTYFSPWTRGGCMEKLIYTFGCTKNSAAVKYDDAGIAMGDCV
jgi:hypothetical protein